MGAGGASKEPCKLHLKLVYLPVGESTLARAQAGAPATEHIPPGAWDAHALNLMSSDPHTRVALRPANS